MNFQAENQAAKQYVVTLEVVVEWPSGADTMDSRVERTTRVFRSEAPLADVAAWVAQSSGGYAARVLRVTLTPDEATGGWPYMSPFPGATE